MKSAQNDSSRSIARLLFASLFACALAAPEARAAVPADFAKTFTVTVPSGLADETLTSFPLLLRLGTGIAGFNYADFQQAGADILVRDANGNALPYELENWDTAGESRLWVRVPSVAAGTTLSVYYGTAETVAPPSGVWSGYAGVWHLNEAGDGATTIADSTANAQNGTSHASSKARSDGKLGAARGLELEAKNGAMTTVPTSAVLDALVPTFTVSGWVRPRTLAMNWGYLFARKTSDADPSWGLQFRASDNANSIGIYSNGNADNDSNRAMFTTSGKFTANTWTKYHVVYDNTTIRFYLDGVLVASKSAVPGAAVNKSNGFGIGGFPTSANHSSLNADQDEVRLMNGAASAAWVAAEYRQESGLVALSYGDVRNTDATAPVVAVPALSRDPATGAFTVSAELSENVPASVICDADGVTNAMTTVGTEPPMTYSATLTGLLPGKTYACLVAATSTGGTVTERTCPTVFYNGDLSVAKVSDANESGLVPGVFRITRADTAHDLAVAYTVSGTAVAGQTFAALSGTATIPAGSTSVDVPVQPLRDRQTDANATVVLTLATGLYGVDAGAGSAELTIVNHRVAQPTDFRKKMTFTPSATVSATIGESAFADFPVLVRLPAATSALLRPTDGTDLLFTDENDAVLSFEIDTFDPDGETLVWVKVPSLSSATKLTVYFGGQANADNDPADVWSRYAVVIHGGDAISNAVAGGPAVTAGSTDVMPHSEAGRIGGGIRKSSRNSIGVNVANPSSKLGNDGKFSVSAWFKRDGDSTHILGGSQSSWGSTGFLWLLEQGTYVSVAAPGSHQWSNGTGTLPNGNWGHVAFAYEHGVALKSYLNGVSDRTKNSPGNLTGSSTYWTFGSYMNTATGDSFKGDMDELRVFDGVASGDWIALEYATMADAAFFGAGQIEDVDVSAPFVGVPVITYAAGVFSVSAEISTNVPASVFYDADGVTGAMATADAELPMTYSAAISGLMEDTTYRCSVLAVSTGGSTISETCPTAFYNGDLSVAKISDANETGLVPGSFRISRADTAHDLAVAYTVGGTAVSGRNYAALSGTATIPAGSTFVDIEVTPILDAQTDADTTVVLTLSAGLYGIDAVAGSAELNVINHRFAQPIDFAKKMTLAPSETILATIGESTFADFPVLVRLPAEVSAEFRTADGSDLVVTDENGTSLPFEVEAFDPAGTTFVWVKVPSLSASTELTVWFGGTSNVDNDPTAVWSRYVGVWHYAPSEADGTSVADATGHGLTGSTTGDLSTYAGPFGCDAIHSTAVVTAPDYDALVPVASQFTASGWFKLPSWTGGNGNYFYFVSKKVGLNWDNANGWYVQMNQSKTNMGLVLGGSESFATIPDVSANWNHFCVVSDGTTVKVYMNGASKASISASHVIKASGTTFAISPNKTDNCADEYRIRAGAASAAETALEYATMADATFFELGAIESVDATTQVFNTPTVVRNASGTYTVTVVLRENSGDVGVIYDAGTAALTNVVATAAAPGTFTDTPANLTADTTYAFAAYGKNANGTEVVAKGGIFYNGELSIAVLSNAVERGVIPGAFRVSRADAAHDLVVNLSVAGTAVAGQAYEALPATVMIPAGATFVDVRVVPLLDHETVQDATVEVSLAPGPYGVSQAAGTATVTVENLVAPSGYNVWIAVADGLASDGANWSAGHSPTASEDVLFDGDFSAANCEWDTPATATVASWTQTNGYTGTVTLKTVYPGKGDFQCLTVTGPMAVMSGTITHPQSRTQSQSATDYLQDLLDNETYRVRIDAGSLVVGTNGRIDARNKGYYHSNSGNHTSPEPSHGGRFSASGQAPYDDVKEPIHIGMPYKRASGTYTVGIGGGAVYLTSTGAIVVDGYIGADTGSDTWNRGYTLRGGAAAGSVYVRGASVTGAGTISASALKTDEQNNRGVGGRVAVIATSSTPIDYTTLQLKATVYPFNNNNGQSSTYGGCGTVYVKDGTMTNGVLIVRNFDLSFAEDAPGRRTDVTAEGDWTFDRLELGGGVQLSVPCGTTLTLPGWDCVTASANSTGTGTPSGFIYRGGTLDFGSAAEVMLSGHWYFAPISNYVFNANVSLADGAAIGFGGKFPQRLANNAYPVSVDRIHCTVEGDLTVPSGCSVNVNKAGAMQDSNGIPSGYPQEAHGGRRSNTMATIGSVFHPRTLPHGQSNSYGHIIPGGAVELSVSGTFTLGGTVTSTGYEGGDGIVSQSAGGSIDISAGRLIGTGTITAGAIKNGQPGGRIAIRLTAAGATLGDFNGTVNCATMGAGSVGSCGSIYIETAADGDRRGTIILDDNNVTCTTYTPICATGYEADDVADFKKASLVIKQQAKGQVTAADAEGKFAMNSVEIDSTGQLDLFGHTLTVKSAKINGVKLAPGTYASGSDVAIGEGTLADYLVDTAEGADGKLVVKGVSLMVIVR